MTSDRFDIHLHGDDLLYATFGDGKNPDTAAQIAAQAVALRKTGTWLEVVPDMSGLTVQFDLLNISRAEAERRLAKQLTEARIDTAQMVQQVTIPVCYEAPHGPDLAMIAERLNLSVEGVVSRHLANMYRIQMIGFLPGFAYCGDLDSALTVPRLTSPRVRVEAGSIGIAGQQTGIYSLAGPGGWPLIGRTPIKLFAASADDPFVLKPGAEVLFQRITADEFDTLYQEHHSCRP